ncbi:MAG: AraC family transcriptional regulator [Imperialibacter sp.]
MIVANRCPDQETLTRLRNKVNSGDNRVLEWPDVVVNGHYQVFEKEIPESSFTIFSVNTDGLVMLTTKDRDVRFCRETICVVNPFEHFSFSIRDSLPVNIMNVHLGFDTYNELLSCILSDDERLLDNPTGRSEPYLFDNRLFFNEPLFRSKLLSYQRDNGDEYLLELMDVIGGLIGKNSKSAMRIPSQKSATKAELFKRVAIGRDIIFSQYSDSSLTVDALSREVLMSKFHFIRVFRQAFGFTPHKLIQQVRVRKALEYIKSGEMTITDVAEKVGFQEANSLYPLIRGRRFEFN